MCLPTGLCPNSSYPIPNLHLLPESRAPARCRQPPFPTMDAPALATGDAISD